MKHTLEVTLILVGIFLVAQAAGLLIINQYIDIKASKETGETVVRGEVYNVTGITPPPVTDESTSWIFIMGAIIVGTLIVLLIIRFKQRRLWKLWFFLSVMITLTVALAPFIDRYTEQFFNAGGFYLTVLIAGVLTFFKVFRSNIYIHNLTEVFIYGGLAALIVPVLNIISAVALLIAISVYDMFAVWQSKHMVSMAKFQTQSKVFAGLMLSYGKGEEITDKSTKGMVKGKTAILGGGDIAFPLLFSGVVLKTTASFIGPTIISVCAALALFLLLLKGQKDKFYPAMPFISAGCFIGFAIVKLIGF